MGEMSSLWCFKMTDGDGNKMKILLTAINAKYIHSNLAVYSLRAYASEYAGHVKILEYTINHRVEEILAGIYREEPDVLCFSCYIWNISYVEELIGEYRKLCPSVPIWVGGPEVSFETGAWLMAHPEVDGVMIGEGERTFLEICRCYADMDRSKWEAALLQIPGIAMRTKEGGIVFTGEPEPIDLDEIPFCYGDIRGRLDCHGDLRGSQDCPEKLGGSPRRNGGLEKFRNRIIYYETSRGCPFSCSYCLSSVDRRMRFRSFALVERELGFFLEQGVPQVKFVDRTFNCNHGHAMRIWHFIQENDRGNTNFHFEIAADLLTEEEIDLLCSMRPGLVQLEIGVQSTNPVTIDEIHRAMNLEKLKNAVQRIHSAGNIHQHLDLIAGLPYEDFASFSDSFDAVYALRPNQLQLGFLKVLKGSPLRGQAKEYGILCHSKPPYEVLRTKWLDYPELLRMKQAEEMLEVYSNSGQFEVTMRVLEPMFESAFSMFLQLGAFYETKGYFAIQHSRVRRCEILLEFAEQAISAGHDTPAYLAMLAEALTVDLYYRENMKSRPPFSIDLLPYRNLSRKICEKGKARHLEPLHYDLPLHEGENVSLGARGEEALPPDAGETVAAGASLAPCEEYFVLFDYGERDPLTHQARTLRLTKEELDEWTNR